MRSVLEAAEAGGVPVRVVERGRLDALARDHQEVVAATEPVRVSEALGERELEAVPFDDDAIVVILDGIVDPQNYKGAATRGRGREGAAMLVNRTRRAADADPGRGSGVRRRVAHLPYARVPKTSRGQSSACTKPGSGSPDWMPTQRRPCTGIAAPRGQVAIVIGSEETGSSRLVRERCDTTIRACRCAVAWDP